MVRSKEQIREELVSPGIIAVIRAKKSEQVLPICKALVSGGVRALEITLTTPDAMKAIQEAVHYFGLDALVGVGTVVRKEQAKEAILAGAEFVVSPIMNPELAPICAGSQKVSIIGACTPTEAQAAHESGADYIKIFPAEILGLQFIKALQGPLPHLRCIPTGGVDENNVADFFKAGCTAVGVGSSLVRPEWVANGSWTDLKELGQRFVEAAVAARQTVRL